MILFTAHGQTVHTYKKYRKPGPQFNGPALQLYKSNKKLAQNLIGSAELQEGSLVGQWATPQMLSSANKENE
jgi:hypothetical protein